MQAERSPIMRYGTDFIPFDIQIGAHGNDLRLPPGYVNGPIIRDYYAVQCCTSGRGTVVSSGEVYPIEKGQCFVTFPEVVLEEHADESDPWGMIWLTLRGKKTRTYFDALGIRENTPIFPWTYNQHIYNCMQEIISSGHIASIQNELHQLGCICSIFNEFFHLNGQNTDNEAEVNTRENYVYSAVRYIEMHYDKDIKISEVSDYVGLNRSYLFTIFKKHMGMSPQDYLISYRMKKACDFLAFPQASISSVAYSVGYDPLVFSKIFKRTIGVSPTEYRRQIASNGR